MATPIEITLYEKGPDPGEGIKYVKKIVSWGLLKRALRLGEELELAEKQEETTAIDESWLARFRHWIHRNDRVLSSEEQVMNRIAEFVVDVFDGQFTVQQLEDGAEASEITTVLRAVISRARGMDAKSKVPTNPPPTPKVNRK